MVSWPVTSDIVRLVLSGSDRTRLYRIQKFLKDLPYDDDHIRLEAR